MNHFKIIIFAAVSVFALNAKASVCYVDNQGISRRGEIIQTENNPPAPPAAFIHSTFANGFPVNVSYEEWVPFTEFSDCGTGQYLNYFYFAYSPYGPYFHPFFYGNFLFPFGHYWGWRPGFDRPGFAFGPRGEFRGPRGFDGHVRADYHNEGPGAYRGGFNRSGPLPGHGPEFNHEQPHGGPVGPRGPEVRPEFNHPVEAPRGAPGFQGPRAPAPAEQPHFAPRPAAPAPQQHSAPTAPAPRAAPSAPAGGGAAHGPGGHH